MSAYFLVAVLLFFSLSGVLILADESGLINMDSGGTPLTPEQRFSCPPGMVLHADRHQAQQPDYWYCIPGSSVTPTWR